MSQEKRDHARQKAPLVARLVPSLLCVASLNWLMMPFLTRRLHRWLRSA